MKGKVIRGKGFRGCLQYLLAKLKQAKIIGGNLLGRTPWTLSREFAVVRQILPDCEKPVLHIPLRLPPGDDIANPVWSKVALRYFELMNLSPDRPWILVRHDEHVHLLTSRISYSGELWYGKWEGLNHINATQVLEKEFNLTRTPGLEGADTKKTRLTSGQLAKIAHEIQSGKTPEIPGKTYITESIESALALSDGTLASFNQHLAIHGVTTLINQGKTSLVTGISFKFGEIQIKGSKVARIYSWKNLLKLLEERKKKYELERNTQENARTSTRTNPAPATASPTGPTSARTIGDGNQNRDVADHVPATGEAILARNAPIPDGRTHRGHPDLRANGTGIVPAIQVEPDAISIEHPVQPASPTGSIEHEIEPTGPRHNQDLQLAQETLPRVPGHVPARCPGVEPDAPEPDLEQEPPPPGLSR
jgi:hypothetical protein